MWINIGDGMSVFLTLMLLALAASLAPSPLALLALVALRWAGARIGPVPGAIASSATSTSSSTSSSLLCTGAPLRGQPAPAIQPGFGGVRGGLEGSRRGYRRGWQVWKKNKTRRNEAWLESNCYGTIAAGMCHLWQRRGIQNCTIHYKIKNKK